MTRMRSVIGKRMRESLDIIPAWQCTVSINMEACMVLRDACRDQRGIKLSYNDILAKAIAVAARKYPLVNARYEQDEIRVYHHTNVGLAVALEDALVVPVVQDIDCKSLDEIAAAYRQQIQKAREGKLTPADMGCGSVTISNLGMYDVKQFTAIVNPPESCSGQHPGGAGMGWNRISAGPRDDGDRFLRSQDDRRGIWGAVPAGSEGLDGDPCSDAMLMGGRQVC